MKNTVEEIATGFNVSKKLAKELIDAVVASLASSLLVDKELRISGFGTFKIKTKPARNGRNPKTGESIQIPERKDVKFTLSSNLKEAIQ
jgi:nucleoid DNA-binding protein